MRNNAIKVLENLLENQGRVEYVLKALDLINMREYFFNNKMLIYGVNMFFYIYIFLYEIVMINDGSTDETSKKVIEYYNLKEVKKPYRRLLNSKEALAM